VVIAISNNVKFRKEYVKHVRNSFFVALAAHFLLFYFSPSFEFEPYVMSGGPSIEIVFPVEIEVPQPPKEVVAPQVRLEPAGEGEIGQDEVIPPNVIYGPDNIIEPLQVQDEGVKEFYAFDEPPALIKFVNPIYPDLSRQAGIEGTVLLCVLVGEDGKVLSVSILRSDVTKAMEEAAIAAAQKFQFRPAKQRTVPVKARMAIPIVFKLH
jgi:TonB family protein